MKQRIINWLLRHYLNAIVVADIITLDKGLIKLGGKPITDNELRQLQAEIKALEGFRIWGIVMNSPKVVAHDKIFNKSLTFDDVLAGKLMLFNLGLQEDIIRVIKKNRV